MKQQDFYVAAPVSSSALCSDSFFEPCSCEENTRNSALAGAASWNVPPTPPAFSVKMGGGAGGEIFSFLFWLVIKEMYSSSCVWNQRWEPNGWEGRQEGEGEAAAL